MTAKATHRKKTDPLLIFALAWAGGASVISLLFLGIGPTALLLVGVAALPFASSRRSAVAFRILAALLFAAFVPALGSRAWFLLAPPALALLVSATLLLRPHHRGAAHPHRSRTH